MRRSLYVLLVTLLLPVVMRGNVPEMKFRRLDTRNGLSSSQVNCVYRDSRGYVWIGTAYGLNRYDGYRFKTFYSNRSDTTSIRDNYTDQIMESCDGKLWLKHGMSYSVYDPVTERFERNVGRELEKYLGAHNAVERVHIDDKKNFWVKYYGEGFFCYNPKTKKSAQIKLGYGSDELNPTYGISSMADYGKYVLATSNCGELMCMDGEKGTVKWVSKWMRENGGVENQDYRLHVDRQGNYWITTLGFTFIYIQKEKRWYKQLTDLLHSRGVENIPEKLEPWDVRVDRHGWIWAATDHEGLFVIDLKNRQFRQFQNNKYDETTLSDNTPKYIYLDPRGPVWIGTYKNGVNQYIEGLASIKSLELGDINTVVEDRHGYYWLGSNERGIMVYDPRTSEVLAHYTTANSPMLGNIMVGSCRASDGSIWFGSYNGGLTRCIPSKNDPTQAAIVNYRVTGAADGLANNSVWSVTEDKWHRIWIGTLGGGIQMLDPKTGKFRTWNTKNTKLPGDYITSAWWLKNGWLMMGTSWYYCFVNPATGRLVNRVIPEDPNVTVTTSNTVCVMEDSRGLIWQGSSSGVCIYDQRTQRVWQLDMTDGLFGSNVGSIQEDQSHTMWVVTDHGVSKVIPERQQDGTWQFTLRSYNNRDGLQQSAYNQRSTCMTDDGKLLIGGQGGLDIINTKALSGGKSKERPVFSGLQLFDVDVPIGREIDGRIILEEALDVCRDITLRFNDQFTIQLASDAGNVNNGKRFVYKLKGFNENWVKTSELNPNITYNSLRAGSYTLCVRMLNDDGTIGDEESQLEITIQSALWRTSWAILLYVLLITLAAFWWHRRYTKRQARRMEAETLRRETEKMQWMGQMKMQLDAEQQVQHTAEPPRQETIELIRQTTDVVKLLRQLCADYQTAVGSKAKIHFLSAVKQLDTDIATTEFTQAIHILLDNSVKFSPGDCRISVGVACTASNRVQIQVADNGIGIRDEYKEHAFDHLPGTEGIGLATVKDIVVAHGGDIRMEDNPGGGTIFFITLPVTDEVEEAIVMED